MSITSSRCIATTPSTPAAGTGRDNFDPYGSSATGALAGGTLTIRVPLAELGKTTHFTFAVVTFAAAEASDEAPTGSFAPGTPPRWDFSPRVSPQVTSLSARFKPAAPMHGKRFAVASVRGALSDGTARAATPTRSATLAGKPLARGCAWVLPRTAKGKRLAVTVHASGVARRYAFDVR